MQTDPNWSNFLYDRGKIVLLDFGAARNFSEAFSLNYLELIRAAADKDKLGMLKYSQALGFLTGSESKLMVDSHLNSINVLAAPFRSEEPFDFKLFREISRSVKSQIPIMLQYRLTPPPEESYSLHRKLSGCLLLCSKIGAKVPCRKLFIEVYNRVKENTNKKE